MAFLQVKSTNPIFSYILRKNPDSGLLAKELRKGVIFGYYSDAGQTYNIYFRDAFNDISYPEYKDQEFEYVNSTRYSSAQFILNALSELLRDAFKKRDVEQDPDGEFANTLVCNMVHLESKRTLTAFMQHFSDVCDIQADEVTPKYYKITIATRMSLFYLLNLTNLFAAFTVVRNKTEYLFLDDKTVEKYFTSLAVIDPPYFIRYHFKIELLRGNKIFEQYRKLLQTSWRYPIALRQGDTVQMRMDAIEQELGFSNHIVDVGCGDGRYIIPFTRKMLKGKNYYAIDTDEECRNSVARKVRLKELTNVQVLESLDAFLAVAPQEKIDFVLGEVIEHMSVEEATQLVAKCLSLGQCNSVIVTTPNADFNQFFFEDKEMRHPDHQFEFTMEEFKEWIASLVAASPVQVKLLEVGDKVNEIPVTLGAVFSRKENV